MAKRLKIKGNIVVVFEDGDPSKEYFREKRILTVPSFDENDIVSFTANSSLLGKNVVEFDSTTIIDDDTGLPFPSVLYFKDFLADNISGEVLAGDNLGNHIATEFLKMQSQEIVFGNVLGAKINLYDGTYGIGIYSGELRNKSGANTTWGLQIAASYTELMRLTSSGKLGVGINAPIATVDISNGARLGTHLSQGTFYVTGNFGSVDNGSEFMHLNGTQGVGIGYEGVYKTGSNIDGDLKLAAKGVGIVQSQNSFQALGSIAIQGGVDGGLTRGLAMWSLADRNWGIYMSQSGANKSFNGGTAVSSGTITAHAIRFRVHDSPVGGFIFENHNEDLLFSIRGNDGLVTMKNLGSGTVQSDANGNLSVSSDERLKNILKDFDRGLDSVQNIQPIQYKWNEESGLDTESTYTGFSAQNIKKSIPEAIKTDQAGYLTLDNKPIIAVLVNSVKELKTKLDKQQKQIDILHDKLRQQGA